jgi:two-component system, NtrC family, sensor kinase
MTLPYRILHIIDSENGESIIARELESEGFLFKAVTVNSVDSFKDTLSEFQPNLVITDYLHSHYDGITAISQSKRLFSDTLFFILTETISEFDAIECIKAGVSNIINKDQISSILMIVQETQKYQQANLEKKQVEEQLARERETLSISLASIGEAIVTINLAGEIVLFNNAAQQITEYAQLEAVGKPASEILHILDGKTNKCLEDPISYLLDIDETPDLNNPPHRPVLMTKNNKKKLISGKITPIRVDQHIHAGYVLVFDDVTEKELIAAQSMLSSKMESIGQLAAGIAHEINTPIQYLGDNLNYIQHALQAYIDTDQKQNEFINSLISSNQEAREISNFRNSQRIGHFNKEIPNAIQESFEGLERVRKIVMAIREFSHPSQKGKAYSDINKSVQTTVTISRNEWKYCADLVTDLDPKLPMVFCRIDELSQVLLNMIVNATHAIQEKQKGTDKEKGKISIKTSLENENILISIMDSGCGISDKIVNRIFDPFFTTKEVGKGTGQGLSLAYNIIVNHHHGAIHVFTEENKGTTFTIEIPLAQTEIEENRD